MPLQATYAMQDRGGKRWQADGLVFETDAKQLNTAWQIGSKLRVGLKIIGSQIEKYHMIAHGFKYVKMFHVFMFKSFIIFTTV